MVMLATPTPRIAVRIKGDNFTRKAQDLAQGSAASIHSNPAFAHLPVFCGRQNSKMPPKVLGSWGTHVLLPLLNQT